MVIELPDASDLSSHVHFNPEQGKVWLDETTGHSPDPSPLWPAYGGKLSPLSALNARETCLCARGFEMAR